MIRVLVLVIAAFTLAACTSPRFTRYTEVTYPPTSEVDVLRTKPADRLYVELGEIRLRLNKTNEDNAIIILKEKAKELGANAIVILGEQSRGAAFVPAGNMAIAVPLRDLVAVAIRYKQ